MAVSLNVRMPDSYFRLVRQFPLTHLRDEDHAAAAQAKIDRLLEKDLDPGEQAYLDVLTDLVEAYEERQVPIPDASEADVLRTLMTAKGLSQAALAKQVRIAQSTLSAVLTGTRTLTRGQIIALSRFFRVAPAAFLPG